MNEEFKNAKYKIVRQAFSSELTSFVNDYFFLKRRVVEQMKIHRIISPYISYLGTWNDPQIPNTYSHYADIAMEILLERLKPTMEKETGLKLYETYSFARIYKHADTLHRHKDRASCEISCTLNLGGDPWPIYLDPTGEEGNAGVRVDLNPGDILIYRGCDLEHWRDPFPGSNCAQVFLHYNEAKEGNVENKYDGRAFIGLPK